MRRHFTLLSPMLNIRPGDLIVVPNFAEDGWDGLVMAKAVASHSGRKGPGECYDFSSSVPDELDGDRRHFVAIDPLFKPILLNKQGQHLKKLIKDGKYRVRVRKVNGELHPELLRAIAKLADADLIEETQTIKKAKVAKPPSDEQRERGCKGEDEVERRLRLKGGFEGFTFVKNRTKDRCGYDFLARHKNREVEIEGKRTKFPSGGSARLE